MSRPRSVDPGREPDADVIVVGAGPAGSTAAYHLARQGVEVLLLEKSEFPREKVCGDGLTPRAVAPLIRMGVLEPNRSMDADDGWLRNRGLRIYGGGMRLEMPWPDLADFPGYGLVRKRTDFDELLVRQAERAGARLHERTTVTGPVIDERTGRVTGVTARTAGGDERTLTAPLVVAADGNSSRLSVAFGLNRRADRPMGVAVRTYFTTPRHDDDWLESWLELWDGPPGRSNLLPGYGWVFGMGDGTSNVGLGLLDAGGGSRRNGRGGGNAGSGRLGRIGRGPERAHAQPGGKDLDTRALLTAWTGGMPAEWQFDPDHQVGPIRGAALPMGFNRKPHYTRGLMLVGDAGGMVNPFNGEGIAYAMESAELAADVVAGALARPAGPARERVLASYPPALAERLGGYYTLGRIFVRLIGNPKVMELCTRHGLPRPLLMRFTLKLLANLTDPRGGDVMDRTINALCKLAPAA